GLQAFLYREPDGRSVEEAPSFVDNEDFEGGRHRSITDRSLGAVQHIEQEGFQDLRSLIHSFEIECLKTGKRQGVVDVVKNGAILPALDPSLQRFAQRPRKDV